jgi:hypothetical protein
MINNAYIYYTLNSNDKLTLIPSIVFKNNNNQITNLQTYDYSLFKFSIFVQSAYNNNETNEEIPNFSKCCIGQLQIYPKAFLSNANSNSTNAFLLTNEINGNTNYQIENNLDVAPNGRLFYSSNYMNSGLSDLLTIKCNYDASNNYNFNFDFKKFNDTLTSPINTSMIYSIQVELLNPGKLNKNDIYTKNFTNNI